MLYFFESLKKHLIQNNPGLNFNSDNMIPYLDQLAFINIIMSYNDLELKLPHQDINVYSEFKRLLTNQFGSPY